MKNYLLYIDCFGREVADKVDSEQMARLTLEFGRTALRDTWKQINDFLDENRLRGEVGHFGKPSIVPFFIISCTENVAARLQEAGFDKVRGVFEATMPFEAPDWHKHLKPVQP